MPDAATNAILVQLGALGILGVGLTWIAKVFVPKVIAVVEGMIADHKAAMAKMGEDHKAAMKEVCTAYGEESKECREERISDRAERLTDAVENRRVLTDLTTATNSQTRVLNVMASKLKVESS